MISPIQVVSFKGVENNGSFTGQDSTVNPRVGYETALKDVDKMQQTISNKNEQAGLGENLDFKI